MVKVGTRVAPANMFTLTSDEAYAGTSRSEWEAIVQELDFLKPVKLEDIKPEDQECDICQESFGSADDCNSPEKPVSLPCGHIFGKDCLSEWIAVGRERDSHQNENQNVGQARQLSRINSSVGPSSFNDLLQHSPVALRTDGFTCPKCRQGLAIPRSGEHAPAIEARLQFWDLAYGKLGILRSVEEEASRQDLWRFVRKMKMEQATVSSDRMRSFQLRAQVSAMRFAMRRAWSNLTPVQCHLRDALFNFACFGVDHTPKEYSAEWYEDRPIPAWCWQFDRIERGMNPSYDWRRGEEYCHRFFSDLQQQTLGRWRRTLFSELGEDAHYLHFG